MRDNGAIFKGIKLGVLTGLLGLLLSATPLGADLEEEFALRWLFQSRGARPAPAQVMVIAIDRESSERLGFANDPGKWPRSIHAKLIKKLQNAGVKVIAFDLLFDKSREAEYDIELAHAMRAADNVVLVAYLKRKIIPGEAAIDELVMPVPEIAAAAAAVAPFPLPKVPARVNAYWSFVDSGGDDRPVFPVIAFQIYAAPVYAEFLDLLQRVSPAEAAKLPAFTITDRGIGNGEVLRLATSLRELFANDPRIAKQMLRLLQDSGIDAPARRTLTALIHLYDDGDMRYLNYYGPARSIETLPYAEALTLLGSSDSAANFNGKAVFVGFAESTQPEQKDNYYTVFSEASGLDLSGVEIAATAFANLSEDLSLRRPGAPTLLAVVFAFGLIVCVICLSFPIALAVISVFGFTGIYFAIAVHQFATAGIWLPLFVPLCLQAPAALAAAGFFRYRHADRERLNIRRAFGYYLPKNVVDQLAQKLGTTAATAAPQLVYGTCLATDVERFTAVAEDMDPAQLSVLMNEYYQTVFRPIHQLGGIVSDVEGDAVLAIWTASQPDHALKRRACVAALDIAAAVGQFNRHSERAALCTRIGLDAGSMSLGSIGGGEHYEYRAVGDIVNTAHRIQGLNKELRTCVLASQAAVEGVDGFLLRGLGSFLLAGKSRTSEIFELLCRSEEASRDQRWLCDAFAEALKSYRARQWLAARTGFAEILRAFPEDGPTRFYLKLIKRYGSDPPVDAWNEGLVRIAGK
ncbi:MAG: adenylate/guanylate cyclase domain-containing protein [Burkholderiales bacterium]|nr:adenylate/guanylate cyclase domain-containing protein [Burkholderiales bacterium]